MIDGGRKKKEQEKLVGSRLIDRRVDPCGLLIQDGIKQEKEFVFSCDTRPAKGH